jgi:sugar phosphate isomerase/epimerase
MGRRECRFADESTWKRRMMIKTSALAAAAWVLPMKWRAAAAGARIPIAVQLYSVRGDCATDFDAALEEVSRMGFSGVEFAGYYGYAGKAKELRQRLDALNLKAAGTHIGMNLIRDASIKSTIEFHQAIGCTFLVVPMDGSFTDPEKSKLLAEEFNKAAEILKPLGMACGYHNHTDEFQKDGDKTFWELFAERTTQDVILQQDCGWSATAGADPVALIRKYPGRTRTVHFKPAVVGIEKEEAKKAIIGQDSVDWGAIYNACRTVGGTEWVVIEQEQYPDGKSAMECTEQSLAGLNKILAGLR